MRTFINLIVNLTMLFFALSIYGQVNTVIPADHLGCQTDVYEAWEKAGTNAFKDSNDEYQELSVESVIDVTTLEDYSISPNGEPCGAAINQLIIDKKFEDNLLPTVLYFPLGTYLIETPLSLKGMVILKGPCREGESYGTHFKFYLTEDLTGHCINMAGKKNGIEDIYITNQPLFYIEKLPNFEDNELTYNVSYLLTMYTEVSLNGVLICSGQGEVSDENDQGVFTCSANIEEDKSYTIVTTVFDGIKVGKIRHEAKIDDGKMALVLVSSDSSEYAENEKNLESKDGNSHIGGITINISGNNNWVKGVESFKTQKYHVYISGGRNNTISGCYFHEAYNYGGGGNAYGVCLSGTSATKSNLIENNVFEVLRHSILLQNDVNRNVIAYNSSMDAHAYDGWIYHGKSSDLRLHTQTDAMYDGPTLNLFEGNIFERAQLHKKADGKYNGPYNTFFRNRAIYHFKVHSVKEELKKHQYAQNVIGCNMNPYGSTLTRVCL